MVVPIDLRLLQAIQTESDADCVTDGAQKSTRNSVGCVSCLIFFASDAITPPQNQ
jgi:hypothetical protein